MKEIEEIYNSIMNDPMNEQFSRLGRKPIFLASPKARILIIGQAPGIKTQEKGKVFDDRSGDTLREWLGIDRETFYNSGLISVLPLDFYFPGKGKTGDLPPRISFADKWHQQLIELMPHIQLIILIGSYAQKYYLKDKVKKSLTQTVLAYEEYLPDYFVLVHPSPLNFRWFKNNPSFQEDIVPVLKENVNNILKKKINY